MSVKTFKRFIANQVREERLGRLGRDCLYHIVLLFLLFIVANSDLKTNASYEMSEAIKGAIVGEVFDSTHSHVSKTYEDIATIEEFWQFAKGVQNLDHFSR